SAYNLRPGFRSLGLEARTEARTESPSRNPVLGVHAMPFTFAISTVTLLLAQAGPAVHAQGGATRFGPPAEIAGELVFSG
ncbi:MAG: hypothetical protein ACK5C3_06820, partial [bacterium]